MKKILAALIALALTLAVFMSACSAEGIPWKVDWIPEIAESAEPRPLTVEKIIPVDLGWDSVFHDETIDTFVYLPYSADNIVAVVLTDGFQFIHGEFEQLGYAGLFITFKTEHIRRFVNKGAYLIFIGCAE